MSPGAIAWAIDALIASALLMVLVLAAREPVRRLFGSQVAYALWALPLLRFFLPALPAGWWRHAAAMPVTRAGETVTVLVIEPARTATLAAAPQPWPWGLILIALWAAGAAAFLVWHAARHWRFCRRLLAEAEPLDSIDGIRVVASAAAPGPLAFGVWRRTVAVPLDFAGRFDTDERALALAHELGHHQRRDLLANWAALAVLALHWCNPLAWRAFRAFRADQELANDARVLAGRAPGDAHAYGRAIVKAASPRFASSAVCHLHSLSDLKRRLRMLTMGRTSRRRLAAGAAAVSLLAAGGLGLTASGSQAAERLTESVGDALQVAPPAPVAEPSAPAAPSSAIATQMSPASPTPVRKRRVVVVKDGKAQTFEGADADAYIHDHDLPVPPAPPVGVGAPAAPHVIVRRFHDKDGKAYAWAWPEPPQVSSANCGGDATRPMVENRNKGGKRLMVICTNRIEKMTQDAERLAANSALIEQRAMISARSSLAMARVAIERDRNLSEDQRREALDGIAQAEEGLQSGSED